MSVESQFRCDVPGEEALAALREAPLPLGLTASPLVHSFHRDIYLDSSDRVLLERGASCRLRISADDRRWLTLFLNTGHDGTVERFEAEVAALEPRQALLGDSEPARRLRGLSDPALLRPQSELEVERWSRTGRGRFRRRPRFEFRYDGCTVRQDGLTRRFEELEVRRLAPGAPRLEQLARALERTHGLAPLLVPRHERAWQLGQALAAEAAARLFSAEAAVVLLALDAGRLAFLEQERGKALPTARGSGETAARHLLASVTGSEVGELALLGALPASEDRDALEVWVARRIRGDSERSAALFWLPETEALERSGGPELRAPETLAALAVAARAGVLTVPQRSRPAGPASEERVRAPAPVRVSPSLHHVAQPRAVNTLAPELYLNAELSQLAFQERVLELGEAAETPLAERLRFLAIVSGNLDEFFAVRVGSLKHALQAGSTARSFDGLLAGEQLEAIAAQVRLLLARQAEAARHCLAAAAGLGVALRSWEELDDPARQALTAKFRAELLPVLTPRAVTQSPGHPFPLIPELVLCFGVAIQDVRTGPVHFAALPLKARLERFLTVPGGSDLILLEEVVRANIQEFYPDRPVEGAWLFRITRAAELEVRDQAAGDLLQAVEEEVKRRPHHVPVRVEIERDMPARVRELLLRELRFEPRGSAALIGAEDLYESEPWLDLGALRALAAKLPPEHSYGPYRARRPFPAEPSLLVQLEEGDRLVHHPYEEFEDTVCRFIAEAARDPAVLGIKLTLYRLGDSSAILESLLTAAESGKDVVVFVELKARFDEARNVGWVRRLEQAGAQVVYGLVGLKIHAKIALVLRQAGPGAGVQRYAHIGTGNYNSVTARFYSDYGLLTADPDITADLTDLFNQLTGSSRAPGSSYRRLLVAPATLLTALVQRIEREIAHAKAGRGGLIRAQLNGLEDPELVAALYRASAAGVRIELVVRTLCVLRPGLPGVSENIAVKSVLGRFLEHGRIYHFGNGGAPEYLIGSADWRPRNLRRRVEVVAPVSAPALAGRLDALLTALWEEPSAWTLGSNGRYTRRAGFGTEQAHLHDRLLA